METSNESKPPNILNKLFISVVEKSRKKLKMKIVKFFSKIPKDYLKKHNKNK